MIRHLKEELKLLRKENEGKIEGAMQAVKEELLTRLKLQLVQM